MDLTLKINPMTEDDLASRRSPRNIWKMFRRVTQELAVFLLVSMLNIIELHISTAKPAKQEGVKLCDKFLRGVEM